MSVTAASTADRTNESNTVDRTHVIEHDAMIESVLSLHRTRDDAIHYPSLADQE